MRWSKSFGLCIVAFWVILSVGKGVFAGITVTQLADNPITGEYQYSVQLISVVNVEPGDGFVIFDFPHLITAGADAPSLTVPGFTFSLAQDPVGNAINALAPSDISPFTPNQLDNEASIDSYTDNPSIENLSFVYNGASPLTTAESGELTLWSSQDGAGASDAVGFVAEKDGNGVGSEVLGGEDVRVPAVPVPEPTDLGALVVMGMLVLCGTRRPRFVKG